MWANQWARNGFIRPVVQASAIPPSGKQIGFSDRLIPANDELALYLICFDQVFRTHDVKVTPFRRNGVDELIHMDVNAVVVEDSEPFEYAHTEIAAPIRILGAIQAILHSQDGLYFLRRSNHIRRCGDTETIQRPPQGFDLIAVLVSCEAPGAVGFRRRKATRPLRAGINFLASGVKIYTYSVQRGR